MTEPETLHAPRLLAIYLRTHAAAARGGVDLFARMARSQADRPWGPELATLAAEVEQDCTSLDTLLRAWGVRPDPVATLAVRVGERVGRLKPNGHVLRRSPLSDLVEVEAGLDAVHAKGAGWRALLAAPTPTAPVPVHLDELLRHAEDQLDRLRTVHARVAARALAPS